MSTRGIDRKTVFTRGGRIVGHRPGWDNDVYVATKVVSDNSTVAFDKVARLKPLRVTGDCVYIDEARRIFKKTPRIIVLSRERTGNFPAELETVE